MAYKLLVNYGKQKHELAKKQREDQEEISRRNAIIRAKMLQNQ